MNTLVTETAILGAGPAGTGPLVCAIRQGRHQELLRKGVIWLDRSRVMGGGSIGQYDITSDTASDVLRECLVGQENGPLASLIDHPVTREVRGFSGGPLPLPVAGRYLGALGTCLEDLVAQSATSAFFGQTQIDQVSIEGDTFVVRAERAGQPLFVQARNVVFALGGHQSEKTVLEAELAPGLRLVDGYADKSMMTSKLVTAAGQVELRHRLSDKKTPRVVILGSSHSAFTAAWIMLERSAASFAPASVRVLYRRRPKVFYPSRAAAIAEGYDEFGDRDLCPVTGRVFRLSGLRLASRDLVRKAWGLGGLPKEPRLFLDRFDNKTEGDRLRAEFTAADVIIPAFGYAPNTVPMFRHGERLRLMSDTAYRAPLVDGACRVLLASSEPVAGAFAIGLASGFVPHGELGGEPSFDGQTNGFWLYQNGIGEIILDGLARRGAAAPG